MSFHHFEHDPAGVVFELLKPLAHEIPKEQDIACKANADRLFTPGVSGSVNM